MNSVIDANLTKADIIVLSDLFHDINVEPKLSTSHDISSQPVQSNGTTTVLNHDTECNGTLPNGKATVQGKTKLSVEEQLNLLTDANSENFEPTVFTTIDELPSSPLLKLYVHFAQQVVRRPTDVVFLTPILIYLFTLLPSAFFLFRSFSYPHAIAHYILTTYYSGAYTLMLHNHIHNNGLFKPEFAAWDRLFPYILSPFMGHTINSYYYHHVKHHHVEGNGPDDLSSTIRYQRDSVASFAHYVLRFLLLIWIDLPLYFIRKGKNTLALKSFTTEMSCYTAIAMMYMWKPQATWWTFCVPLIQMRVGMMVGNWGQHALVDEEDPASDFRSSITLIDVPSNRHCFNDGYHTSHHLNPRRHWRDHPAHFIKQKAAYSSQRALVFKDIDYLMMTITLLRKDYARLVRCLVPINEEQLKMTDKQKEDMLRLKTKRFTEEDIKKKFGKQ